jgi:hypothetical protein
VATVSDQHVIEALGPDCPYPTLGEGVRLRCEERGEDRLHSFGPEHLVEGDGELGVRSWIRKRKLASP